MDLPPDEGDEEYDDVEALLQAAREEIDAEQAGDAVSCATEPCDQVEACPMVGGCVQKNFPGQQLMHRSLADVGLKGNAPALNGTKPARTHAHPGTKHKDRKDLTWTGRK